MEQLDFNFDDLTPDEQRVYLKAAQRLLDEADPPEDTTCELCRREAPDHASDCLLRDIKAA